MTEKEEKQFYVCSLYEEYINKEENRNTSYGELAYIYGLDDKGLEELETELCEYLYGE